MYLTPLQLITALLSGSLCAWLSWRRGQKPARWFIWFTAGALMGLAGLFFLPFFWVANSLRNRKRSTPTSRPPPKPLTLIGPTDKLWYYIERATHLQKGPLSRAAFEAAWKTGKITPSTLVWHEELSGWKALKSLLKVV